LALVLLTPYVLFFDVTLVIGCLIDLIFLFEPPNSSSESEKFDVYLVNLAIQSKNSHYLGLIIYGSLAIIPHEIIIFETKSIASW